MYVCDATKNPFQVASFFTLLNSCAVFFKESHLRMAIWSEISNTNKDHTQYKRLQTIGDTR
ncbi:Zinc finger MYM-type protein 1 [Aphis craccivora]|uniref:Zinc finger MYM-type protein 1 n=1 Tax=Aphis craccivora TaxID=307492 RepID=A0A6G0YUP9_APHCR|nr:Zinc finger MYM-type protein 1 [Aphis craccivora]